jgi:archaeal chaperonin
LIKGIVLDKEVVHSGMPKRIEDAKIDSALEIEKNEINAEIRINEPEQMQSFLDNFIRRLLSMNEYEDMTHKSGINLFLLRRFLLFLALGLLLGTHSQHNF